MMKKYFLKEINLKNGHDCNEDVFASKKEKNYTFLTTSKFEHLVDKNYIEPLVELWCLVQVNGL